LLSVEKLRYCELNLIIPYSLLQGFPKFPLPEGEGYGEGDKIDSIPFDTLQLAAGRFIL
jgi:hypothetical protein